MKCTRWGIHSQCALVGLSVLYNILHLELGKDVVRVVEAWHLHVVERTSEKYLISWSPICRMLMLVFDFPLFRSQRRSSMISRL